MGIILGTLGAAFAGAVAWYNGDKIKGAFDSTAESVAKDPIAALKNGKDNVVSTAKSVDKAIMTGGDLVSGAWRTTSKAAEGVSKGVDALLGNDKSKTSKPDVTNGNEERSGLLAALGSVMNGDFLDAGKILAADPVSNAAKLGGGGLASILGLGWLFGKKKNKEEDNGMSWGVKLTLGIAAMVGIGLFIKNAMAENAPEVSAGNAPVQRANAPNPYGELEYDG